MSENYKREECRENYVDNHGQNCLLCNGSELRRFSENFEFRRVDNGAEMICTVACFDCGKDYLEIYWLADIKEISHES